MSVTTLPIRTARLTLRRWRDRDREPFAALNSDPEVMRYFPVTLTREESDALIGRVEADFEKLGYGYWAVEVTDTGRFIGFVGLSNVRFTAHFTPAVQIAWRLERSSWGYGYATEAASRTLAFGFENLLLQEVVSFTSRVNTRSLAVMKRLGMTNDPADDFDRPTLKEGHRLRPHVLWRMTADRWRNIASQ